MRWKQQAQQIHREAYVFYFAFKHPRTRWHARLIAACTTGYLLSPIQLIPSFIPVVGLLDDVVVVFLGVKLLQRVIPPDVLTECRERAEACKMARKEELHSPGAIVVVGAVIAILWLIATVAVSAVMAAHMYH